MRAGVAHGELISPVLFSLYVNDIPVPSHHVELALYADDTAVIATSRKPALRVSYLEFTSPIRALAQEIEDRYQRVEEHGDALHTRSNPNPSASCSLR
jgi:hypothetical protein